MNKVKFNKTLTILEFPPQKLKSNLFNEVKENSTLQYQKFSEYLNIIRIQCLKFYKFK